MHSFTKTSSTATPLPTDLHAGVGLEKRSGRHTNRVRFLYQVDGNLIVKSVDMRGDAWPRE